MSQVQIPLISVHAHEGQMSGTQLMDIMSTTLRDSWGVLLGIQTTQQCGLEPFEKDEHWKRQTELHLRFLRNFWNDDEGFCAAFAIGLFELARTFLTNELHFQAKFESEVRSYMNESSGYEDDELKQLFEYLLATQAAIAFRLGEVLSELKSHPHHYMTQETHDALMIAQK